MTDLQRTEVHPFGAFERCPKCGSEEKRRIYCDGEFYHVLGCVHKRVADCPRREHHIVRCEECRYEWNEEVLGET